MSRLTSFSSFLSALFVATVLLGPSSAQTRQCVLRRNTGNCPRLVQNQTPVASCGANACYNYCNGQYAGCCAIGDFRCSVNCAPQSTSITITAGCRLSDAAALPPTPPTPPTPRPTPAPRQCAMRRNTQNCPRLVQNQAVVASCGADGCYNYCNDVFQGCCSASAFECSMRCTNMASPIVMTSGCRLSDKANFVPTPPTPRPTPAPRQCVFRRNVGNCPRLMSNQTLPTTCGTDGCYNFCNGRYSGCCNVNDMECGVRCSSSTSSSIVITAGCQRSMASSN